MTEAAKNLTVVEDTLPNGDVWRIRTLDARGNMVKKTYPGAVAIGYEYEYDDRDNLVTIINPDGSVARKEYDDRDNLVKETYPGGRVYVWEYDDRGNKVKWSDPYGRVVAWEYDDQGKKVKTTLLATP